MNFYLDSLLNLPDVTVESCVHQPGEVHLKLRLLKDKAACPHCQKLSEEIHQNRPISLRDLPVFGRATYLKVPRRQFYCSGCQRYFTESLNFMDEGRRYTRRYETYICQQVQRSNISKVSRAEGLTFDRIQGIVKRQQALTKIPDGQPLSESSQEDQRLETTKFSEKQEVSGDSVEKQGLHLTFVSN